jgi:RecJ-like exonuclease
MKKKATKAKTKTKTKTTKKSKSKRTKVICLSHKEDADGISSAALIREAFGGYSVLVDYPGQMNALESIKNDEKLKTL